MPDDFEMRLQSTAVFAPLPGRRDAALCFAGNR
ncbi:hypothetical protein TRN7648_02062 [Tropicibacter naphthalenivorans]|uniref:Uncharacterized protein n=1 Tax=Tropicibacter naphthalenivorans TaxID=441103 RepID=A0A0P1GB00_9RHOB|nr:hypothetical protein TRN7648_02062 [Tropicibacter naphthalenivorans]